MYRTYRKTQTMKKFLFLLLPTLFFGQQFNGPSSSSVNGIPSEADITLFYGGIVGDPSVQLNKVQVNDKIILVIDIVNLLEGFNMITFAHIDLQYNKNALTLISETYKTPDDSQNYTWTQNAKWTPGSNYPEHSLWDQWVHGGQGGGGYASSGDYITKHYQSQKLEHDFGGDQGTFVEMIFQVNELPEESDWSKVVNINMARAVDNSQSKTYNPIAAFPNQSLDLAPKADIDLGGVSFALEFGDNTDITNFDYSIAFETQQDIDNDGELDNYWQSEGGPIMQPIPANGVVDVTDYIDDVDKNWGVIIQWRQDKIEDFAPFYANVVTVSDYMLLFKELGQHGEGAINSAISMGNADIVSPFGLVDSNDAYKILAHIMGIEHLFESEFSIQDPTLSIDSQWYRALKLKLESDYDTLSADNYNGSGFGYGFLIPLNIDFASTAAQTFKIKGTWVGDVNLSHSAPVDASVANTAKSVKSYGQNKKVVDEVIADFRIEENNGNVEVIFDLPDDKDLSASQFIFRYDNQLLKFESVEADTGVSTTNFITHKEGYINLGSLNTEGDQIQNGTYKVIFTPKTTLQGTLGLVNMIATDGADQNKERVNIILQ